MCAQTLMAEVHARGPIGANLFVRGLPKDARTNKNLKELFNQFGPAISATVALNDHG